jgi:cellulose biosynthesis protein BcsQ
MEANTQIITIANQKGGTGSSTLIPLIASELVVGYGLKVLVIDTHSFQKSIVSRRKSELDTFPFYKPLYDVADVESENIITYLAQLNPRYDIVLIDWSGRTNDRYLSNILFVSHAVIMPVIAGEFNIWSTLDFLDHLRITAERKRSFGLRLDIFGFINMFDKRIVEHRNLRKFAEDHPITMLKTTIRKSVEYTRYWSTIVPLAATESRFAKEEVENLTREILEQMRTLRQSA